MRGEEQHGGIPRTLCWKRIAFLRGVRGRLPVAEDRAGSDSVSSELDIELSISCT